MTDTLFDLECATCGNPLPYAGRGRPRKFCDSCRPQWFPKLTGIYSGINGVPTARLTDPETSHLAARRVEVHADNDRGLVLLALVDNGPMHDFDMAAVISAAAGFEREQTSLGVRRKELVTLGLVERAPVKPRPNKRGSLCILWQATEAGIERARELRTC